MSTAVVPDFCNGLFQRIKQWYKQFHLETTFKLYDVPQKKIQETIDFVSGFAFEAIAKEMIESMQTFLKRKIE